MYLGQWLKPARNFVDAHVGDLASRPTWLFSTGPIVGNPPPRDDPNAMRAGLVEQLVETTHARGHKLFGGKLAKSNLNWCEKVAVRCAHASDGDFRDRAAVDEWAATIARELEQTSGRAEFRRHLQAVRRGAGARRLLVLGRAWPDARLPRPERRREDDGDARGLRARRAGRRRGALGRAADRAGGAAALRLHAGGARPLPADAGRRAARLLRRLHGLSAGAARIAAARWLERLGLAGRADAKVEELSHGNQQRAQLAAALLHEPELLVLDEPFAGLDPVAVQTLAEVLRGEAARGAAVLFSSHQLELVEDICEEVAIIDHGRIVATGDVDALRRGSQQRRIELQLEGAPPQWLPDVAGVELVERRNGDLRLLAGRDVDPEQVLAAAERSGRVVAFSYGPPSLAELFLELVAR